MAKGEYEDWSHAAKDINGAYENLVNAIFAQGYEDLVFCLRQMYRFLAMARDEKLGTAKRRDANNEARMFLRDAKSIEDWFRDVLPKWRDLDPVKIIDQAYRESENDAEAVFANPATTT